MIMYNIRFSGTGRGGGGLPQDQSNNNNTIMMYYQRTWQYSSISAVQYIYTIVYDRL